ncbi:hypothetical protein P170DRAFT_373799 [Aspergillus steynii IBT 23096]|uniref:Uncharacterized protein n=1 Tax=Aspergillus steynii IBT 23096 TaxID=1392250 RepID=A0A2I2GNW1_9EURO|nr:uncharacterized protein P170DRAFT_373799 [Aspergillus steynii IBT 23096]PLB54560.1 hypothetical protein P170DRAFT_373799 [Aspergillus steynii IBT 23096]
MPPMSFQLLARNFDPMQASIELSDQWKNPSDVFSVLLILGGDIVARALAQVSGSRLTPVAFSFGWVAYAVTAVVSAVGENKLMPPPDCPCKVINTKSGYLRDNTSWIISRIVRDYEYWMDGGKPSGPIRKHLEKMIDDRWTHDKLKSPGLLRPTQAGLCVSVYTAEKANPGYPGYDHIYFAGMFTAVMQLGLAAIPCGIFGDWGIITVTAAGIILSMITGGLGQWQREKWACRQGSKKTVILTKGNGSQHAIMIIGNGEGLDLEDLATGQSSINVSTSIFTRVMVIALALFWILLLITAAALTRNTWFLLAIGGIGMLQNILTAGARRTPEDYGVSLKYKEVIGHPKVMETLFQVERKYPRVGRSMRDTFFPGQLLSEERDEWNELAKKADALDNASKKKPTEERGEDKHKGDSSNLATRAFIPNQYSER